MTTLTSELNLVQAQDADDTADYLTLPAGLAGSLAILDGLFNATTGHTHSGSHQGAVLGANAIVDNTLPGAKLVDGSVTLAKLVANFIEVLFAGTYATPNTNYVVAASVMFVFCNTAITVTLPAAGSTNRPITVAAVSGNSTVNAASGTVIGGSANQTTGAITNGSCAQGDSFTYKSDGTNWRVV